MLSETLNEGLGAYRIGPKVRALRLARNMALAQLGAHTGLSAGMLSKIETAQAVPTLPTLLRIALVFGVGLDHFFAPDEGKPVLEVVRREDRIRLPNRPQGDPAFHFESLDFPVPDRKVEAYLAEFPANGPMSEPHSHAGVELVYVFSGVLEVHIHDKTHCLNAGDSMYFDGAFDHSYRAGGTNACQVIVALSGMPET